MKVMKAFSIIIFLLVTGIHLYASLRHDRFLRNLTKPFLVPAIFLYYCVSAGKISLTLCLALLFSWLGDLLLMKKSVNWMALGGLSFMASHVSFVLTFRRDILFSRISVLSFLLPALCFICASLLIYRALLPHLPQKLAPVALIYLLINSVMNCFAWYRLLCLLTPAAGITALGAILFYLSDTILFFVRFKKDFRLKSHFGVMLTYALGQFLIVSGLL